MCACCSALAYLHCTSDNLSFWVVWYKWIININENKIALRRNLVGKKFALDSEWIVVEDEA